MSQLTDMQDIAEAGVQAQAGLDHHLTKALEAAAINTSVTCDGVAAGMVNSPLKAKLLIAKARSLEGAIAYAAVLAAELHIDQTKICKDNNVDTGTLASVGGVVLPPQPLSGGR